MKLDDHLCLCFHVSKRKVLNFIRIEKPKKVAQSSECHGAGTGCGWCRPFLKRLFLEMTDANQTDSESPTLDKFTTDSTTPDEYAAQRAKYVKEGGGKPPPGATPV